MRTRGVLVRVSKCAVLQGAMEGWRERTGQE
jgi:hypothetical protein